MQAILTRYFGPTNSRGSRIKASCERGSITIPYDDTHGADAAHIAAAQALVDKFTREDAQRYATRPHSNPWLRRRVMGALDRGMVHVFLDNPPLALPEEVIIRHIVENYPEASAGNSLRCTKFNYDALEFEFADGESEKTYTLKAEDWNRALDLLLDVPHKWPRGCTPQPSRAFNTEQWDDWFCRIDAMDVDAFCQLAVFGEVIYG